MTAGSVNNPLDDSLDLVEWLMERHEEFSLELTKDAVERPMRNGVTEDDLERWMGGRTTGGLAQRLAGTPTWTSAHPTRQHRGPTTY